VDVKYRKALFHAFAFSPNNGKSIAGWRREPKIAKDLRQLPAAPAEGCCDLAWIYKIAQRRGLLISQST